MEELIGHQHGLRSSANTGHAHVMRQGSASGGQLFAQAGGAMNPNGQARRIAPGECVSTAK